MTVYLVFGLITLLHSEQMSFLSGVFVFFANINDSPSIMIKRFCKFKKHACSVRDKYTKEYEYGLVPGMYKAPSVIEEACSDYHRCQITKLTVYAV